MPLDRGRKKTKEMDYFLNAIPGPLEKFARTADIKNKIVCISLPSDTLSPKEGGRTGIEAIYTHLGAEHRSDRLRFLYGSGVQFGEYGAMSTYMYSKLVKPILARSGLPFILLGDHGQLYYVLRSVKEFLDDKKIAVVSFDAHIDHGFSQHSISHANFLFPLLNEGIATRVVSVGNRGQVESDAPIKNLSVIPGYTVKRDNLKDIAGAIASEMADADLVVLDIDIDAFLIDPKTVNYPVLPERIGLELFKDLLVEVKSIMYDRCAFVSLSEYTSNNVGKETAEFLDFLVDYLLDLADRPCSIGGVKERKGPTLKPNLALTNALPAYSIIDLDMHLMHPICGEDVRRFKLNQSGYDILRLCDGDHTLEDIVNELSEKYRKDKKEIKEKVEKFLSESGFIE